MRDHESIARQAASALQRGADRPTLMTVDYDATGKCLSPVSREDFSRPSPARGERNIVVAPGSPHPLRVRGTYPCRKCENCRLRRGRLWAARAISETACAPRTWLLTLTLRPEAHFLTESVARSNMRLQGLDFDALTSEDQFQQRWAVISRQITLYLKRVRKGLVALEERRVPFRYLCVAEAHKSGLPHAHLLIHELDPAEPVRQARLYREWSLGFADGRLVHDPKRASYVCKYLAKDALARVRASQSYGSPPNAIADPQGPRASNDPLATFGPPRGPKDNVAPGPYRAG